MHNRSVPGSNPGGPIDWLLLATLATQAKWSRGGFFDILLQLPDSAISNGAPESDLTKSRSNHNSGTFTLTLSTKNASS